MVHVAPTKIDTGQMIQISASVSDKFGAPVVSPTLYMEILDSKGKVYWRLAPIARDTTGFSKLISTNELKPNTRYTVRVSTNTKLSPNGWSFFQTSKRKIATFIPFLIAPLVLVPKAAQDPTFLIYRTELDARVCPICKPHEGKKFRPNDPKLIRIGAPDLGGQTHFGCRCHYDLVLAVNPARAKVERMLKAQKIVIMVRETIRHKQKNSGYRS